MAISYDQVLSAPVVTRVISRIKTPQSRFQNFFGANPGGPSVNSVGGHHFGWDIFDRTRTIARGRAPGVGPATVAPKAIGHVSAAIYRAHEKLMLLDERLFRTRPLGEMWGTIDVRGQRYVRQQENYLAQRFRNSREFMISRMLRGTFMLLNSGDDWVPVDSGGTMTIDYQVPATNKNQLALDTGSDIIGTSWATVATAPVPNDCLEINAGFEQQHGRPLRHVWCNTNLLVYLLTNTDLKNLAGTANVVFEDWRQSPEVSPEGIQDTGHEVVFRGIPWLRFHIYDAGLEVNGTYTKFIPDANAIFLPDPGPDWFELVEGSEIVRENVLSPGGEQFGLYAWTEPTTQPAGFELLSVDNCLPSLYIPKCVAYGTVVF